MRNTQCATADCFCLYLCFRTPPTTRHHTCAYVTRMKDNVSRSFEPRHVIPDTRISSGQCPRCYVNVTWDSRYFQGHTKKWALRHIHVNIFLISQPVIKSCSPFQTVVTQGSNTTRWSYQSIHMYFSQYQKRHLCQSAQNAHVNNQIKTT
jgi:hypothetical protein